MRRSLLTFAAMLAASAALAQNRPPPPQPPWVPPPAGQPVENKPPETTLKPAFEGQTRAPYEPTHVDLDVKVVTQELSHPWAVAFLPDGRALVTERVGRMRVVTMDGKVSPSVGGVPGIEERQGGGIMDVEVDPDFRKNHFIYFDYAEARGNGAGLTVARARLVDRPGPDPRLETFEKGAPLVGDKGEKITLQDVKIILRVMPTEDSYRSFGSRIVFGPHGTLFVTNGDLDFDPYRPLVQDLHTDIGKILRINRDGTIPKDNPYAHVKGARPEIWAIGFRNPLGAALDAHGELWEDENGPRGGDELNHVRPGRNYGWPVITYGEEYSGKPVGEGIAVKAGMEQPVYYWDPVIAPSGLMIYSGKLFPQWKGSIFIGSLRQQHLVRLSVKGDHVTGEERLLTDLHQRIREAVQGPDGAIYVITDADRGELIRLSPRG